MSARWYVVQTQPHAEARADAHLRRQGFNTFLPTFLKRHRHARKTQTVSRPLFPRYMFVRVDPNTQGWRAIASTIGVMTLIGGETGPTPVREGIVEALLAEQESDGHFRTSAASRFVPGAAIRVV